MPEMQCTIMQMRGDSLSPELLAQIDTIFFEASSRPFIQGPERDVFRERWLGRYLRGGSDVLLVAMDGSAPVPTVAGYLVGALEDPSSQPRFADIPYFAREFRDLCRGYSAHLHINFAPAYRSKGFGAQLISAFAARAAKAGAWGMHVVTSKTARNVGFYTRCGFIQLGEATSNGGDLIFLGKCLPVSAGRSIA